MVIGEGIECTASHAFASDYSGDLTHLDTLFTYSTGCTQNQNEQFVSMVTGGIGVGGPRFAPSGSLPGPQTIIDFGGGVASQGGISVYDYSTATSRNLNLNWAGNAVVVGAPTGSITAQGAINVQQGVYLNGTAYTNP
jgi:hypothetical protein